MAGLADLVGVLMQSGLASSGSARIGNAMGEKGLGGAGGALGDLLRGSGGGLLGDLMGSVLGGAGRTTGASGGSGLGALAGSLAGVLLGNRAGGGGGALGGSALAMIAGLALQALGNRGGAAQAMPLGLRAPETPAEEAELENTAGLLLQAMINAAKADGQVDRDEMDRIVGRLREAGADDDALAQITAELEKPMDLEGLVAAVHDEQTAAEVYTASLFAIEVDTEAERDYLQRLATALQLDASVTGRVHEALGIA